MTSSLGIALPRGAHASTRAVRMSRSRSAAIGEPDDLRRVDLEQLLGKLDPAHDGDVRRLVPEVAEVDRERRLRRAETPTRTTSASSSPLPTPSSYLTANSIASMRLKYEESSGARAPGSMRAATPATREIESIGCPRRSQ